MKHIILLSLLIFMISLLHADFTGLNYGAKSMAMGNAYISISDGPAAIFWNSSGLAYQQRYVLSVSHENIYSIPGFYNDFVAFSIPLDKIHLGVGISQMMLSGEYAEQVSVVSGAYHSAVGPVDMGIGVSMKHMYAHLMNTYDGSNPESDIAGLKVPGKLDADVGAMIKYQRMTIGASARNILQPEFKFDSESVGIEPAYGLGVNYAWKAGLILSSDYHWDDHDYSWHIGSEIWFYNVFAPRLGVSDSDLTAGFGLKTEKWNLDGAVYAHETLGSTYRLEFSWAF